MSYPRVAWLLIGVTVLSGANACDRPTGPELVARIDQFEHDLLSDSTAAKRVRGRFAGSWGFIRLLPNAQAKPDLRVEIDGDPHQFEGFVFERIVIRQNPNDGYPCPLTQRSLLAAEGGRQGFLLRGSDFSQSLRENPYCSGNFSGGMSFARWPSLEMIRPNAGPRVVGVSGSARIDDLGAGGACNFLKLHADADYRVDCEFREYGVSADVQLSIARTDAAYSVLSRRHPLAVPYQRVPGVRIVIHCNEKTKEFGGCANLPTNGN